MWVHLSIQDKKEVCSQNQYLQVLISPHKYKSIHYYVYMLEFRIIMKVM